MEHVPAPVLDRLRTPSTQPAIDQLLHAQRREDPARAEEIASAIDSSPQLRQMLEKAHANGDLARIVVDRPEAGRGPGTYSARDRDISLQPDPFHAAADPASGFTRQNLHDSLVMTLGQQASLALGRDQTLADDRTFRQQVRERLVGGEEHQYIDFTAPVGARLEAFRMQSGEAGRAAFNALSDRIAHTTGQAPDGATLARRAAAAEAPCMRHAPGEGRLPDGLAPDARGQIPSSQREAMARCHFDSPYVRLGPGDGADHRNYAASHILGNLQYVLRNADRSDQPVRIDLQDLGLDAQRIKDVGLYFGLPGRGMDVLDQAGRQRFEFRQNRHIPVDNGMVLPSPRDPLGAVDTGAGPADPLQQHVRQSLEAQLPPGTALPDLRLAQLTAAARQAGIQPGESIGVAMHDGAMVIRGAHPTHVARVELDAAPQPQPRAEQPAQDHAARAQAPREDGPQMHG